MKDKINWALTGTGGISNNFAQGLRAASDAGAVIYAAVSRTPEAAETAAAKWGALKAYGDYDAMLADSAVDIVYIGAPHSVHKDLALKAMRAGKAVLCEKPMAINAACVREMIACARERGVFLMEALWARFTPPMAQAREWLAGGAIGEPRLVQASFGFRLPVIPASRLFDRALGGGALLDAGIYPLAFASMVFGPEAPSNVLSTLSLGETGVDEETQALLSWGPHRAASVSAALRVPLGSEAWVHGTEGSIRLPSCVWARAAELLPEGKAPVPFTGEVRGNCYNYEAGEVMACLRAGALESPLMPLAESLALAETMDTIRAQAGFTYPGEPSPLSQVL